MTFSWVVDMLKRKGKTDAEIDAELVENYGWTYHTVTRTVSKRHNKGWYEKSRRRARERAND